LILLLPLFLTTSASAQSHYADPHGPGQTLDGIFRILFLFGVIGAGIYYVRQRRTAIQSPPPLLMGEDAVASLFVKKDVFFASSQDLEGKLVLTSQRLFYVGLSTQTVLLNLYPQQIVSIQFSKSKIQLTFLDAAGRQQTEKYRILPKVSAVGGFSTLAATTYQSTTTEQEFQAAVNQWASNKREPDSVTSHYDV
jgi:hypothetical protein